MPPHSSRGKCEVTPCPTCLGQPLEADRAVGVPGVKTLGSRHGPAPGATATQSMATEHPGIVCEGARATGLGEGHRDREAARPPVAITPRRPLGGELSPSADLDDGVGADAVPCGGLLPSGLPVPLPPQAGS